MTEARARFRKGDIVMPSKKGMSELELRSELRARITGFGRSENPFVIRLVIEGTNYKRTYHHEFWEHASAV